MNDVGEISLVALQRYTEFVEAELARERRRWCSSLIRQRVAEVFRTLLLVFIFVDIMALLGALILFVASDSLLVFVISSLAFTAVVVKMTLMALGGGGQLRRKPAPPRQVAEDAFPA